MSFITKFITFVGKNDIMLGRASHNMFGNSCNKFSNKWQLIRDSIYMYVYICVCLYVCMYVCLCMYMYVCMCVCVCICMYVCVSVYVHACVTHHTTFHYMHLYLYYRWTAPNCEPRPQTAGTSRTSWPSTGTSGSWRRATAWWSTSTAGTASTSRCPWSTSASCAASAEPTPWATPTPSSCSATRRWPGSSCGSRATGSTS